MTPIALAPGPAPVPAPRPASAAQGGSAAAFAAHLSQAGGGERAPEEGEAASEAEPAATDPMEGGIAADAGMAPQAVAPEALPVPVGQGAAAEGAAADEAADGAAQRSSHARGAGAGALLPGGAGGRAAAMAGSEPDAEDAGAGFPLRPGAAPGAPSARDALSQDGAAPDPAGPDAPAAPSAEAAAQRRQPAVVVQQSLAAGGAMAGRPAVSALSEGSGRQAAAGIGQPGRDPRPAALRAKGIEAAGAAAPGLAPAALFPVASGTAAAVPAAAAPAAVAPAALEDVASGQSTATPPSENAGDVLARPEAHGNAPRAVEDRQSVRAGRAEARIAAWPGEEAQGAPGRGPAPAAVREGPPGLPGGWPPGEGTFRSLSAERRVEAAASAPASASRAARGDRAAAGPAPVPRATFRAAAPAADGGAVDGSAEALSGLAGPDAGAGPEATGWLGAAAVHGPASRPAAEAHAPAAARQVAQAVVEYRGAEARLVLDPEELGPVRLTVTMEEGRTLVHILAERPETAEMMRRHADLLLQDLAESGVAQARISFAAGGETGTGREGGGRPQPPAPEAQPGGARPAPEAAVPGRPAGPARGLDMRV